MTPLRIISPHLDDAAFSLAATMAAFCAHGAPFGAINCFTLSNYAPLAGDDDPASVSALRASEDREFFARLPGALPAVDLGRLDAPIRKSESYAQACRERRLAAEDLDEVKAISRLIAAAAPTETLIVPLGLGNHIDHRIARDAALMAARSRVLAFYEELPYAEWACDAEMRLAARAAAFAAGTELAPVSIGAAGHSDLKLRLISTYRSQLSAPALASIALFSAKGERLWATQEFLDELERSQIPFRRIKIHPRSLLSLRASMGIFKLRTKLKELVRKTGLTRMPQRSRGGALVR